MADRKLTYKVDVDSSGGVAGVEKFSRAVRQELKNVESDFEDTSTAGEKVANVLSQMAVDMDAELARAAQAADALKAAMGTAGEGVDFGQVIGGLQKMGLTFEDIVADADKLAAAMKQLDEVQVKGLDSGLGGVNTKMGELGESARSSKSVLANMVGNSVQDLGALGGLAGSAGVAIGQMGEYMADAASSGEKLGSVIKNFAGVGVPLLAIGVTTQAISNHFADIAKTKAFNKEEVDAFAKALETTDDAATAVATALQEIGKVQVVLDGTVHDITPRLAELGLTVDQFSELVAGGQPAIDAWGDSMKAAGADGDALTEVMGTAVQQSENLAKAQKLSAVNAKVFGKSLSDLVPKLETFVKLQDPLKTYPRRFDLVADAITRVNKGLEPTGDELKAIKFLMDQLGMSEDEVFGLGADLLDQRKQAAKESAAAVREASRESRQAIRDLRQEEKAAQQEAQDAMTAWKEQAAAWKTSLDEAQVSAAALMDEFDAQKIDTVTTALEGFLSVRQPGVSWLDTLGATKEAMGELFSQIKDNEGVIPDIFSTGSEKGRDFRDAIDQASQQINDRLVQALKNTSGNFEEVRRQAQALRDQLIEKIEMRTGLSMDVPEERTKIMGLVNAVVPTDAQIQVGIALAKDDLAKLKAQLSIEALQSLLPKTALQIQVAMAEGDLGPREAAATAQEILNQNGVAVDLGVNTKKADDDLVAFAEKERTATIGVKPVDLPTTAELIIAGPGGRGWPPIPVEVVPVLPSGYVYPGAGGGTGGPRSAPAATSSRALVPYTAPKTTTPVPIVVNNSVTVNSMNADSYDVMRAVDKASRQAVRLLPKDR